jgi:hypothetical protein
MRQFSLFFHFTQEETGSLERLSNLLKAPKYRLKYLTPEPMLKTTTLFWNVIMRKTKGQMKA